MKNYLYALFILIMASSVTITASGASGVYLTYDDFKNNKLLKADEGTFEYHYYHHNATMKVGSKKENYDAKKIWGFLKDDVTFRIGFSPEKFPVPCKLISIGNIYCWRFREFDWMNLVNGSSELRSSYVSYGLNGELFLLDRMKQLEKSVEKQRELKPLLDCVKGAGLKPGEFIVGTAYECLEGLPGFVKDEPGLIPKRGK